MKNKILTAFIFAFLCLGFVSASNVESTIVSVEIEPAEISFSVPEGINFGFLTQGYESEEIPFSVNNTGETDIRVEVSLDSEYTGTVFQNLKFRKEGTVTTRTLSSFYLTIDKPENTGESVSQGAFVWLDLSGYNEEVLESFTDSTALVFTAMPD